MKNVTVTLDTETARWARIEAAKREMSVSSLLRGLLQAEMAGQESFAAAKARYLSRAPKVISSGSLPKRQELHDRAALR